MTPAALCDHALSMTRHSYSPYSHYAVGAALLDTDGRVHGGTNVENVSFGLTICAERAALFHAVAAGVRQFTAIAIAAAGGPLPSPCGACRQVLAEFCAPELDIYLVSGDAPAVFEHACLGELLPRAFRLP